MSRYGANTAGPDFLFESSWEVCNKVGGIYTVLSTKARTLHQRYGDRAIFIGPDLGQPAPDFIADPSLFPEWAVHVHAHETLRIKVGRWNICGMPPVVLVDFKPFFSERNTLFFEIWETFGVDSSVAYGDYDESCIFAYAAAQTIRSFYRFHHLEEQRVIAHFDEWMLGMGLLFLRKHLPAVATVFTTHATTVGRAIAGNGKPLYGYMQGYDGDQMARELHVEAKHALEKQAAHRADSFTTVSRITAMECARLLDKAPDTVTPNGFEPDLVPAGEAYEIRRGKARETLLRAAGKLLGAPVDPEAFLIATGGRYEYRNKGLDVFIDAMNRLRLSDELKRETLAFILVPAWVYAPRADLKAALEQDFPQTVPMQTPLLTHWLHRMADDPVMNFLFHAGFSNRPSDRLKIIFVPCYMDGCDGIFNLTYYDLLIGMDATVFPSYYEPWGYTPLESIAFGVPTVTTDLAGFGAWAKSTVPAETLDDGVAAVHRTDDNYGEVTETVAGLLLALSRKPEAERKALRKTCFDLASKAEWQHFIAHYETAYGQALAKAAARIKQRADK
ncbi:MAG: glycogen/starch synthase [Tannerella sp.]|jgi:glycosyltransferase involved in cell wall biosynthesis|nr:glycogen/starch synthase [Tannerella sp.]